MSEEDRELLARISRVAGQINRHKNQQAGLTTTGSRHTSHPYAPPAGRGSYHPRPYRVGRPAAPHRHRTLVLNNGGTQTPTSSASDTGALSDASNTNTWVTRSDRHLQLINSSVYEKDSQNRAKAIEETRQQRLRNRNQREKAKLKNFVLGQAQGVVRVPTNPAGSSGRYEVIVDGLRFAVAKNGSKLLRLGGDVNIGLQTPKTAIVGGVNFHRSKNGNLYREGIVKAQRKTGVVKKLNEPCKHFSTTGIFIFRPGTGRPRTRCRKVGYGRPLTDARDSDLGSCPKGPQCRFQHDPAKVAVCKDFLLRGSCPAGSSCDLSHDLTPQRTPTCLHFMKGNCVNANCRYAHSKVPPSAPICRTFGMLGYCEEGLECNCRHSSECPDFSNTGTCKNKGCKLLHRERASVLRQRASHEATGGAEMEDVSSDDEPVDSDDVDSDEVEEFLGQDENDDSEFTDQKDFISF